MSHSKEIRLLREANDLVELLEMLTANSADSDASAVAWGGMQRTLVRIRESITRVETSLVDEESFLGQVNSSGAGRAVNSEDSSPALHQIDSKLDSSVSPLSPVDALSTKKREGSLGESNVRSSLAGRVQLAPTSVSSRGAGRKDEGISTSTPRSSTPLSSTPGRVRELLGASTDVNGSPTRRRSRVRIAENASDAPLPKSKAEL
jgi:hypothetical protein